MLLELGIIFLSFGGRAICMNGSSSRSDAYYPSVDWSDTFDWKLIKVLSPNYRNLLISPISLKIMLALLYEGSAGNTEREFENVLQFDSKEEVRKAYNNIITAIKQKSDEYILDLDTRIFLDHNITAQRKYKSSAISFYQTEIQPLNYENPVAASREINSWIQKITRGKIAEIVEPDELREAVMVIANALFFKGTWYRQFPKNLTHPGPFYFDMGKFDVPYMSTTDDFYFHESNNLDAKILRLPYRGNRFSMFIVLPNSIRGLPDLIKKINLQEMGNALYFMENRKVHVTIPKFRFQSQTKYVDTLRSFGLNQMFQNTASFAGIAHGNQSLLRMLVVSNIVQKTGIEVDEEGSVAYAASDITIGNKFGEPDYVFNATHPFLFYIEEESTGTLLFMGKVENPLEEIAVQIRMPEVNPLPSQKPIPATSPTAAPAAASSQIPIGFNSDVPNLQPVQESAFQKDEVLLDKFNYFDIQLLQGFAGYNDNLLISPLSIKTTLAMIWEGAKGVCAQEISDAFNVETIDQARGLLIKILRDLRLGGPNVKLDNQNAVFASNKFEVIPEYKKKLSYYDGHIIQLDFTDTKNASNIINNWVSQVTRGAIKEIVTPQNIYAETAVVLTNALFFKGKWKIAFDEASTKNKCFRTINNKCVNVPMMEVSDTFRYYYDNLKLFQAIDLPYEDGFSMLILAPTNGNNVKSLIRNSPFVIRSLNEVLNNLSPTDVILEMPRFEIDFSSDLTEFLKPLKIRTIFERDANLTGIVPNDNVRINSILHKTKIEVNEQGTKAAAATGAIVIPLMGSSTQRVILDSPFIFFIYHQATRSIIFEGSLMQPYNSPRSSRRTHQRKFSHGNFY